MDARFRLVFVVFARAAQASLFVEVTSGARMRGTTDILAPCHQSAPVVSA